MSSAPLLACHQIGKSFGGVVALRGVDFTLNAGEVHGLVGSNGAGKSTLMKILAGVVSHDEGEIHLHGKPVTLGNPLAAMDQGIAMVYQELSGIGQLSVAENLFLGRQPVTGWANRIDWKTIYQQAEDYLRELEIEVNVRDRLDSYPLVIRQMVEIARGLHSGAQILILDEPTSALSPPEVRRLFTLIRQLKQKGVAMVFISHFIEDVIEICDHVTILKDGRLVTSQLTAETTKHEIIHKMLGHSLEGKEIGYETGVTLPEKSDLPPVLEIENLSRRGLFADLNLGVSPGECLGIYGFVGAGHQELLHVLAGSVLPDSGNIRFQNVPLKLGSVRLTVKAGIVLVAADREQTLVRTFPIYQNVTMSHLTAAVGKWIQRSNELEVSRPLLQRVGCRPPEPELLAGNLSGGNQQKVVMAKWLLGDIRVLLLEEPTRGMDVGAKEEIMALVQELKAAGTAVILASTEPELLLAQADRILCMSRGIITHEFHGCEVEKSALMKAAEGSEPITSATTGLPEN